MRAQEEMQRALKQRDEELRQSQKMDALGRLAGGVAHDFNNILTVIVALSSMLLRGLRAGDPMRTHTEKIAEAARRGASLTRQLLVFSRKDVVEMKELDLNACVAGMGGPLRRLIGEDIELVTRLDPGLGRLRGDESQVQQVVVNLVVNARQAMPEGGRITIHTNNVEIDQATAALHIGLEPGPFVVLSVEDTGIGVEEPAHSRLFEPFSASEDSAPGLGLATVYGVAQQSGGFITVESQSGGGTAFRIHFPRVDQGAIATALPTAGPAGDSLPGATILLVEDEEEVRNLTRQILESQGCEVIEARWAGEAAMLAQSQSGVIDLMLTDVVMPGESGGELARWMTEVRPEMPVLFMSGYPDDEIVRHGVEARVVSLLHKPFSPEELLAKVRTCLEGRQPKAIPEPQDQPA
jgi:nitrogen-specific signal transduction histidine kinase/ActR/RegA family two-component response regulator